MNTTQTLEALAAQTRTPQAGHIGSTGSGATWMWTSKPVNGNLVTAMRTSGTNIDNGQFWVKEWFEVNNGGVYTLEEAAKLIEN